MQKAVDRDRRTPSLHDHVDRRVGNFRAAEQFFPIRSASRRVDAYRTGPALLPGDRQYHSIVFRQQSVASDLPGFRHRRMETYLYPKFRQKRQILFQTSSGQHFFVIIPQPAAQTIAGLKNRDRISLPRQIHRRDQSRQTTADNSHLSRLSGRQWRFFRCFVAIGRTGLFQRPDENSLVQLVSFASPTTRLVTDTRQNPGKRNGSRIKGEGAGKILTGQCGDHPPRVHMQGAGCRTGWGLLLNTLAFPVPGLRSFHGALLISGNEPGDRLSPVRFRICVYWALWYGPVLTFWLPTPP